MPTMRQQMEQARLQKSSLQDVMEQQKQQSSAQRLSLKSKGGTAATCNEMSEELTSSTDTDADEVVQLSNLALVQEAFLSEGDYPVEAEIEAADKPVTSQQPEEKVGTLMASSSAPLPPPPPKRSRKPSDQPLTVRFSDEITQLQPPKHDDDDEDPKFEDIWWTLEELSCMECNARYMVKECQEYQEEVICTVLYNKAFLTAQHLAKSMPEDELHVRLEDVGHHANSLGQWASVGNSRRGLEVMVSDKAMTHADESRIEVLKVQQEHKEGLHGDLTSEEKALALAKAAQDASRAARIMARMMGHADANSLAAAEESARQLVCLPEPPEYMLDKPDYHEINNEADMKKKHKGPFKPLKKMVRKVFGRGKSSSKGGRFNPKQWEASPDQAAGFRPSFLQQLDYGDMSMELNQK